MMRSLGTLLALLATYVAGACATTGVAFSAVKTNDQRHVYNVANQQLTFDLIDTNLGNCFNGSVFRVPFDGLYLFTFSGKGKEMSLALIVYEDGKVGPHDSEEMRVAQLDSSDLGVDDVMSSNSVILELDAGDEVGLILKAGQLVNADWTDSPDAYFTSFNGALLYASTNGVSAFSAATSSPSHTQNYPIRYEYEDTEIGYEYDFDDTTFTAPVPGLFLFTFAGRGANFRLSLEVNGQERRYVRFLYHVDSSCYYDNSVSNHALLVLKEGDQVHVLNNRFSDLQSKGPCSGSLEKITEFSGVLMAEIFNSEQSTRDNVVAFSAVRSVSMVAGERATVEFDIVELNIGQAFDGVSTFTAPVRGYYLFMFSMVELVARVDLMVNGVSRRTLLQTVADVPHQSKRVTASTSAILLLSPSDEVQLSGVNWFFFDEPTNGTVFSGVLLREI